MDADFLLIHKMKDGDETAMELFVKKYYPAIRNYCCSHTYTIADAEDLAKETFVRFFQAFPSYRHTGKLANYLYVIAGNLCRDSYKKKQDLPAQELPDRGENTMDAAESRIDMEQALKKLPEELREVIILHYFRELKLKEVAEITGAGLPLVKYRIGRAKKLLGCYLGEEE